MADSNGDVRGAQGGDVIRIEHLRKVFGDQVVLKDINVNVAEGSVTAILGPSGSGKSTMLRCINQLEEPTAGKIFYRDVELTSPKTDMMLMRRKIGIVFQHFNLFPHMTILKNLVYVPTKVLRQDKGAARDKALELLERVGLKDKADAYPEQLSGGQQQRVAIARALAKNPKLLLADEPTGALDYKTGKAILKLLQDTCRTTGKTVVLITHNSAFCAIADRVIHVREGKVASVEVNDAPASADALDW